ncbi:MAG: type IV pilus modification protein PilV [Burkholderiaceae bacterium]|nr:type IV pilus modification protein PilV [Burkholderiaceae bacterium]
MQTTKQSGFTLVEVLVSIFVLALGVIGVAGMQLTAMRSGQQSTNQTVAVQLATELADKMRANAVEMKKGDSTAYLFSYNSVADSAPDSVTACYSGTGCSAEQMAAYDIYEWKLRLKAQLPGGRAVVCRDSTPFDSSKGTYTWDCTQPAVSGVNSPMVIKIGWLGKGKNLDGSENTDGKYPPSVALTVEAYSNAQQ